MEERLLNALHRPVEDRLYATRTVLITGEVTQDLARRVSGQLVALAADSEDDLTLLISSQGGHVESGDTIHDLIRFITPRVRMIGSGWVASAAALIYIAVPREDRFCLPNTRFLLHQPAGGVQGPSSDIAIEAEQIVQIRRRINRLFADATGQPLETIEKDTDRNFWLTAERAVEYGLVGRIIQSSRELD